MRALIRAEIRGFRNSFPERKNRDQYDTAVIELFKAIGYDARYLPNSADHLPTQEELEQSEDVANLFQGVPDPVKSEELRHLVMLGYTSEGQAKFVVCSINQSVLHIRVRDDLFDKLRRACKEICIIHGTMHRNGCGYSGSFESYSGSRAVRRIQTGLRIFLSEVP